MKVLKKRKILFDIVTIFAALFITTALIIIFYSYRSSSNAVIAVGDQLIERTNQSVITELDNFLRPAPLIKISEYLLNDQTLQSFDMKALSAFTHILLESYPQLQSIYLTDIHGNFYIENRIPENMNDRRLIPFIDVNAIPEKAVYLSETIHREANNAILSAYYKDENGMIIKTDKDTKVDFDPRLRPWFIGAKNSPNQSWLGAYPFYGTNQIGVTAAFSISEQKKLDGVVAADLSVSKIEDALKKFSINAQGILFIVNNHGQVISAKNQLVENEIEKDKLPTVDQLHEPMIREAYAIHSQSHETSFTFSSGGKTYRAVFTPYAFSSTETWEIARILPIETFVGAIQASNKHSLLFSLIMLSIGILLIFLFAHKISVPIIRLAKETKDIPKFKFTGDTTIKTHIYEVQVMIDSLNAAKSALYSFAKYVPKTLVQQLLHSKVIAQLGGEKKEITILFTDIEKFTDVAEQMDPEALIIHISNYLNIMTRLIQQHAGNIDKYIGDAVMAFWGAPIDDANHAYHACEAVLACRDEIRKLNIEWAQEGKPVLHTRFGLNTGSAIVGNMGSSDRLNYTAIGDAVNLAARLEGLNKNYNTEIIVSESMYQQCKEHFEFRLLDTVNVRGKRQPTVLYELIAKRS